MKRHELILMEGAVVERLRRDGSVRLHPSLANAPLIYEAVGRQRLGNLYRGYLDIARSAGLPMVLCTPTWRANRERVARSGVDRKINADAAGFMLDLRNRYRARDTEIQIGGMIGCKNDCYRPGDGLSTSQSEDFHAWQIAQLAGAGVDFLIAVTLPNLKEAAGIARAMARTGLPYLISFVIDRRGRLLDGTPIMQAVNTIDQCSARIPLGYLANCAYPTFLDAERQPRDLFQRLIGYQANASSLDQRELDGTADLQTDTVEHWADHMRRLHRRYGMKLLGGCCGTDQRHIASLVAPSFLPPMT